MVETKRNIEEQQIPAHLIRDVIGGKTYYYKGYKNFLNNALSTQDIMPSSGLQSFIIMYLNYLLVQALGIKKYRIFTSESGNHLAKNENYGLDLAVYDSKILSGDKINTHYTTVPPLLVVEVDIKVELDGTTDIDFIQKKTQSLLDYGVPKVIWVISKTQKLLIAEKDKDWLLRDWSKSFELMEGIEANIGQYLKENDIVVE